MSDVISTFEQSLSTLGVTCERTNSTDFDTVLKAVIDEPAVGTRLPFAGVSLADTPVTLDPSPSDLERAVTGVTPGAFGIAEYGTLALESSPDGSEPVSLFPENHVAVISATDILPTMSHAFERLSETIGSNRSSVIFATGPSVTADMGALVTGVHGPTSVDVIILEGVDDT